jgi:hypothetical protein
MKDMEIKMLPRCLAALLMILTVSACAAGRSPQPIAKSDYSGTGDLMARCMQYASESYCERQIWGGDEK